MDPIMIPNDSLTISHTEVLLQARWLGLFGGLGSTPTPHPPPLPENVDLKYTSFYSDGAACLSGQMYLRKKGSKHYVEHTTIITKQKSPYPHHYYN